MRKNYYYRIFTYFLFLFFFLCPSVFAADEFKVAYGSYVGDNADNRTITISPSFTPVAVLIKKNASSSDAYINLSCTDLSFSISNLERGIANVIQACGSGSFQVGSHADVNLNTITYHYVAFGAGPSLAVGSYSGNNTDNRDITISPSFQPGLVLIHGHDTSTDNARGVFRTTTHAGDLSSFFVNLADAANLIQAMNADGFEIGTSGNVNTSGITYYYLAIQDVSGLTASGTYLGDGTDNRDITVGFNADSFVMTKSETTIRWGFRFGSQTGDNSYSGIDAQAANFIQSVGATTFQVGSGTSVNFNTSDFIWWALKAPTLTAATNIAIDPVIFP